MDGIAVAQELVSEWFRNKKGDGMLLKLDFARAYDVIDWNFIFEVVTARKFGSKWIQWMHFMFKGSKIAHSG